MNLLGRPWQRIWLGIFIFFSLSAPLARAAETGPKVYVIFWFDTEDYLLPASDDAARNVADLLTREGVRGTFKVVGEKARTLERRKRFDVIEALKKHEIGYHSAWHSVQPSPALYLSNLGWDEGVAEFDRREGPGRDDVQRVFGVAPSCYGQPGSSWGPHSFGAMRRWGMPVYLDGGRHVGVDGRPHFYCGLLTLYQLAHTIRADLNNAKALPQAQERFLAARTALLEEGGGVVSIVYHPCEFVHKQFWDSVNFKHGANPPREHWKLPPQKTPEETRISFEIFSNYVRFMQRFRDVHFITASEAGKLYRDKAQGRVMPPEEIKTIAAAVGDDVNFQRHGDLTLSPAEVFALLNEAAAGGADKPIALSAAPLGPTGTVPVLAEPAVTDWSQFQRTSQDLADYLKKQGRVPSSVWLGSKPVPPEAYLAALAKVVVDLQGGKKPDRIEVKPAKLGVARYVADDDPKLWPWVIFPPGFRAPLLMDVAKRQAWTLKPALLDKGK